MHALKVLKKKKKQQKTVSAWPVITDLCDAGVDQTLREETQIHKHRCCLGTF